MEFTFSSGSFNQRGIRAPAGSKNHTGVDPKFGFVPVMLALTWFLMVPVIHSETEPPVPETDLNQAPGYIDVENGKLYYEDQGTGEVIIFVHDGLIHSVSWANQYKVFGQAYRVVRYDRRGYGRSTIPKEKYSDINDLNQVFIRLNIASAILIGCSAGSELILDFTIEYPEKVKELILIGSVVRGFDMTSHFITRGGRMSISDYSDTAKLGRFFCLDDPYEIAPDNPEVRQKMLEWITAYPHNLDFIDRGRLTIVPETPTVKRLSEITCPVLILNGEFDMPDVHAHSGAIAAGVSQAKRMIIPGAAHLANLDQPAVVNQLILEFCAFNQFQRDVQERGLEEAINLARKHHAEHPGLPTISENSLNLLGYQYLLEKKEIDHAVAVFELNTVLYPDSFNVYDSLGEAYLTKGDQQQAIRNYQKSLDIKPDSASAKAALEKLSNH